MQNLTGTGIELIVFLGVLSVVVAYIVGATLKARHVAPGCEELEPTDDLLGLLKTQASEAVAAGFAAMSSEEQAYHARVRAWARARLEETPAGRKALAELDAGEPRLLEAQ